MSNCCLSVCLLFIIKLLSFCLLCVLEGFISFLSTFSLDEWNGKFDSNITEFDGELIMFNLDTDHGIPLVVPLVELAAGEVLAVLAVEGAVAQV